jgi:hypothetical protein
LLVSGNAFDENAMLTALVEDSDQGNRSDQNANGDPPAHAPCWAVPIRLSVRRAEPKIPHRAARANDILRIALPFSAKDMRKANMTPETKPTHPIIAIILNGPTSEPPPKTAMMLPRVAKNSTTQAGTQISATPITPRSFRM